VRLARALSLSQSYAPQPSPGSQHTSIIIFADYSGLTRGRLQSAVTPIAPSAIAPLSSSRPDPGP
jgi:hypothetical protein